jgi:hypothetical protein
MTSLIYYLVIILFYRFDKPNEATWEQVHEKFGAMCSNFLALADLVMTIPASSADAERGFNRLKITKTDWRSKLTDDHLSDQMMVMLESASILQFDPLPAIALWNSVTTRRERGVRKIIIKPVMPPVPATNRPQPETADVVDMVEDPSVVDVGAARITVLDKLNEAMEEDYCSDDDYDECDDDELRVDVNDRIEMAKMAYKEFSDCININCQDQ